MQLRNLQYETRAAYSSTEAVSLSADEEFDLYILEREFGDGTGLSLCKLLLALHPTARVIFFSVDPYRPSLKEALEAGAIARLINKGEIDELIETIRNL